MWFRHWLPEFPFCCFPELEGPILLKDQRVDTLWPHGPFIDKHAEWLLDTRGSRYVLFHLQHFSFPLQCSLYTQVTCNAKYKMTSVPLVVVVNKENWSNNMEYSGPGILGTRGRTRRRRQCLILFIYLKKYLSSSYFARCWKFKWWTKIITVSDLMEVQFLIYQIITQINIMCTQEAMSECNQSGRPGKAFLRKRASWKMNRSSWEEET